MPQSSRQNHITLDRRVVKHELHEMRDCFVFTAIGDSITEGFWGQMCDQQVSSATDAPDGWASHDGRNIPIPVPTTPIHAGGLKYCRSWQGHLNDLFSEQLGAVYINNEGVGGITTEGYLEMMTGPDNHWNISDLITCGDWRGRQKLLQPEGWLIHSGVNGAGHGRSADAFETDLRSILDQLQREYGANTQRIWLARPCYYYNDEALALLKSYLPRINAIYQQGLARRSPDFSRLTPLTAAVGTATMMCTRTTPASNTWRDYGPKQCSQHGNFTNFG